MNDFGKKNRKNHKNLVNNITPKGKKREKGLFDTSIVVIVMAFI